MATLFYYQFMIKKWVIMKLSIDLPFSPPVGQHQSSKIFYEFYGDFGTHFSMIFDKKPAPKSSQCSQSAMFA